MNVLKPIVHAKRLIVVIVFLVLVSVSEVLVAYSIVPIINYALAREVQQLTPFIIRYGSIVVVLILSTFAYKILLSRYGCFIERKMLLDALTSLSGTELHNIDQMKPENIMTVLNNDIRIIKSFIFSDLANLLLRPLTLLIATIYLLSINMTLTVIVISILIASISLTFLSSKRIPSSSENVSTSRSDLVAIQKETLKYIEDIKLYNAESFFQKSHAHANTKLLKRERAFAKLKALNYIPSLVSEYVPIIAVVFFGGFFLYNGQINIGQFVGFLQLMTFICLPMSKYASSIVALKGVIPLIRRYKQIIENSEENPTPYLLKTLSADSKFNISVNNLSFSYEKNATIIGNASFNIAAGEKVCIIGKSGAGKSTLIKLLMGFYRNYSGEIALNGEELKTIQPESIYDLFSYLDQMRYVLPGSARMNVTATHYHNRKVTDNQSMLNYVLNGVGLNREFTSRVIQDELILGESGSNLSGGEIEKISVARAIYKDAPCLILDEPCTNFDSDSVEMLISTIKNSGEKTVVIVTHDVRLMDLCDKALLINDDGSVSESVMKGNLI